MLYRDCANVTVTVQVHDRVLIKVFGFENRSLAELDLERVGICKIFYFHGTNDRSKNALCTVSPSGRKTSRGWLNPQDLAEFLGIRNRSPALIRLVVGKRDHLAGLDAHLQAVLTGRQRACGKRGKRARGIDRLVEVQDYHAAFRPVGI
jgi:hypothetical protein